MRKLFITKLTFSATDSRLGQVIRLVMHQAAATSTWHLQRTHSRPQERGKDLLWLNKLKSLFQENLLP
jgi:hypothetical protein